MRPVRKLKNFNPARNQIEGEVHGRAGIGVKRQVASRVMDEVFDKVWSPGLDELEAQLREMYREAQKV
jgi:hypothetical protein